MKIALIDNINNNMFALTRYFRALGISADLFLIPNSSHQHFAPEQDSWEDLEGVSWIKEFPPSYNWKNYLVPVKHLLRNESFESNLIISEYVGIQDAYSAEKIYAVVHKHLP